MARIDTIDLDERLDAACEVADTLTRAPGSITEAEVDVLREAGGASIAPS